MSAGLVGKGGALGLRASHEDRGRAVRVLRTVAGADRLIAEEPDEWVELAPTTRTVGGLAGLTRDLPAEAVDSVVEARGVVRIERRGGSARRGVGSPVGDLQAPGSRVGCGVDVPVIRRVVSSGEIGLGQGLMRPSRRSFVRRAPKP
ncbi:DUF1707 domain-containing protein [Streptomyces sp. M41]|uniref:DUF1707 SHOCT-like domain-containing protein n=1 Tax=Streptomyces sp. M41 TaxID=3059412 RepID=UPI00374D05E4